MNEPSQLFASSPPKRARIEIIPLIDVIFFLLATFVLFTLSLQKSGGLPVELPKADSGEAQRPEEAVTVSLTKEGTIAWDKEPVTLDEFIMRLQAYKSIEPDPRILLNGDEDVLFTQARYVIDEIRKAGVNKILFETKLKTR